MDQVRAEAFDRVQESGGCAFASDQRVHILPCRPDRLQLAVSPTQAERAGRTAAAIGTFALRIPSEQDSLEWPGAPGREPIEKTEAWRKGYLVAIAQPCAVAQRHGMEREVVEPVILRKDRVG